MSHRCRKQTYGYQGGKGGGRDKLGDWHIHTTIYEVDNLDFPGGAVVKNLPASAGDMGSRPGPGRSHMLRSN